MKDEQKITLVQGQDESISPLLRKYEVEQVQKTSFSYNDVTSIIETLKKQIEGHEEKIAESQAHIEGLMEKKEAMEAMGILEEAENYNKEAIKPKNE